MTITFAKFVQSRIKLLDEFESMRLNWIAIRLNSAGFELRLSFLFITGSVKYETDAEPNYSHQK